MYLSRVWLQHDGFLGNPGTGRSVSEIWMYMCNLHTFGHVATFTWLLGSPDTDVKGQVSNHIISQLNNA